MFTSDILPMCMIGRNVVPAAHAPPSALHLTRRKRKRVLSYIIVPL